MQESLRTQVRNVHCLLQINPRRYAMTASTNMDMGGAACICICTSPDMLLGDWGHVAKWQSIAPDAVPRASPVQSPTTRAKWHDVSGYGSEGYGSECFEEDEQLNESRNAEGTEYGDDFETEPDAQQDHGKDVGGEQGYGEDGFEEEEDEQGYRDDGFEEEEDGYGDEGFEEEVPASDIDEQSVIDKGTRQKDSKDAAGEHVLPRKQEEQPAVDESDADEEAAREVA